MAGCRVDVPIVTWDETDDPAALVAAIVHDLAGAGAAPHRRLRPALGAPAAPAPAGAARSRASSSATQRAPRRCG